MPSFVPGLPIKNHQNLAFLPLKSLGVFNENRMAKVLLKNKPRGVAKITVRRRYYGGKRSEGITEARRI